MSLWPAGARGDSPSCLALGRTRSPPPFCIESAEPITPPTVIWDGVPLPPGGFTEGWSAGDTILTLSHGSPLVQNTEHNAVVIYGEDVDGNVIITGPAANPWRFTTGGISPEILS